MLFRSVCIALLMIVGGTLASRSDVKRGSFTVTRWWWRAQGLGVALALYVFMADALSALDKGLEATQTVLPTRFNWPLFWLAFALMAAPVARAAQRACPSETRFPPEHAPVSVRG